MDQLPINSQPIWNISDLTSYLRDLFESNPILQDIWVHGEISNLSRPSSGHLYFTLKDPSSSLRCVMWRNSASRLDFNLLDGQEIEAHGSISIYDAAGQYQLYVDRVRPIGEGKLFQEFLKLKQHLESEGLFDQERKRPIPAWPERIGLVTSPTGAALRDIVYTIRRRYPLPEVVLAPTIVQGAEAPNSIISSLELLNERVNPDVIIVARGGGSIEDLWAFNNENVARAIGASHSPVITGVGHETDFTISDFVSDLRAPTPTAAAELATPDKMEIKAALQDHSQRLSRALQFHISVQGHQIESLNSRLAMRSPKVRINIDRQLLDELSRRIFTSMSNSIQISKSKLNGMSNNLQSLNPLAVLGRGYASISHLDGRQVRSIKQISEGDRLNVRLLDGKFVSRVENTSLQNK